MLSRKTLYKTCLLMAQIAGAAMAHYDPGNQPSAPTNNESPTVLIILKDCSGSFAQLPVPDTSLAFVTQFIRLAGLAEQPIKIAVVLFGGQGVAVLGDEAGMPTAAYESLHQAVLKSWPKPDGGTPLEEAMERCIQMIKTQPADARVSVVLFSDGRPDSGVLRPDRYAEVREEMNRRLKRLHEQYQGNSPGFIQKAVSAAEVDMQTRDTEQWKALYAIQVQAEYEKTLKHAAALKEARVRFVSVDYTVGIPELKQIHEAAGGKADDYVFATPPSVIIPKLHALGLTALPRVIVGHPQQFAADPKAFTGSWTAGLDAVGEAALVTVVFDPPIPDFKANVTLQAIIDGKTRKFSADNLDTDMVLSFDSAGNVVAATISLDTLPKDGRVELSYTSQAASLHVPSCVIYTHLRMSTDLQPQFRPRHLDDEVRAPFHLSPNQPLEFVGYLRSGKHPQPYAIAGMEPVLRDRFNGHEVRVAMKPDPQRTHVFASGETRVSRGSYDLELNITLPSGARIVLRESKVLEVELRTEAITIEIPLPSGDQTTGTSYNRAHVEFPPVGDDVQEYRIRLVVRSWNISYPVTVAPSIVRLADENGVAPHEPWITFDRPEIDLEPGRSEPIIISLRVPKKIEESLQDGVFQGRLTFERLDFRQPIPLRRYEKIVGVADDDPIEPVTFRLKRPRIDVVAPRGPFNALRKRAGVRVLVIPVSFWHPFRRRVVVEVRHTSVLPRDITTLAEATFVDRVGRRIPSVRLVPSAGCEVTQEVGVRNCKRWVFDFEFDDDDSISEALGSLVLSGPGLIPLHIPVHVSVRHPLLGQAIKAGCYGLAGALLLLAIVAAVRLLKARKFRTGQRFIGRCGQTIGGLLELKDQRCGLVVQSKKPATVKQPDGKTIKLRPNGSLPKGALAEISNETPCTIEADGRKLLLTQVHSVGDRHLVYGKFADGGRFDRLCVKYFCRARTRLAAASTLAVLGLTLFYPTVLAAAQWLLDVVYLFWTRN